MVDFTLLAEAGVAIGTLLLAYFTYRSVKESERVRKAQYDVNLDLFTMTPVHAPAQQLHFHVVNYGPGLAKDVLVESESKEGYLNRSSHLYLAPLTPSEPVDLGIKRNDDNEFSFTISYSDILNRKWVRTGKLAKDNGAWEFVTTSTALEGATA